ncbi:MAG: periplasmic sugar-binding protein of ABC transporter [Pirellulaceae bacterium]|nr:MAG: periplasmic sugar-binding protein of ABC transporter [Pirellulaceae bacterium]
MKDNRASRHKLFLKAHHSGRGSEPRRVFLRRLGCILGGGLVAGILGCRPGTRTAPSRPDTGGEADNSSQATRGTIGLSVLTLTNPFFKVIADTMQAEAAKYGYEVIVTSGEFDVARQQNQVKDFIVRRVSAIVLCPCDSRAIGPAIQEANAAGIPVFTADIACLAPEAKVVSHIATDNYGGGKQAALAMIEALGPAGGKVVILDFKQAESCILRVKGFKEVIAQHNQEHPDSRIEIVAELPGDGQADKGYKAAEDALQAHPDLAGIFAINDPSALGARAAVEKAGKADQVVIIGFDGQPMGKQAIREGRIYADPIQFPDRIGKLAVESIVKYFRGEAVEPVQLIPTALYRREDALKEFGTADQSP